MGLDGYMADMLARLGVACDGAWCEGEELLASMYGFPHLPATGLQSEEHVRKLCEIVARFVRQVQQVGVRMVGQEGPTGAECGAGRCRCIP